MSKQEKLEAVERIARALAILHNDAGTLAKDDKEEFFVIDTVAELAQHMGGHVEERYMELVCD